MLPAPLDISEASSVVIVAAHPDDIKNCTGAALRALGLAAPVVLIQVTKGENYGGSTTKEQALAMGDRRCRELLEFLDQVGIARDNTFLMGIPNTSSYMLEAMRDDFFVSDGLPFYDPIMRTDRVPYEEAYEPHMPFCGAALVSSIAKVLAAARPTHVFTHHPRDDHRDHRATAFFARQAVAEALTQGALLSRPNVLALLGYYKRLAWPPKGDTFLTSEIAVHPFGLDLVHHELSDGERARKRLACQVFVPTLPQGYIDSYMKRDELFWRIPVSLPAEASRPRSSG